MSVYVVLFPADDEAQWHAGTEAEHQATSDVDEEFRRALEARGGAVSGGAGLTPSSQARTLRRGPGAEVLLDQGPHVDGVEQLSGFFVVTCDSYDALVEAAQVLTRAHPVVEVRPVEQD